MSANQTTIFVGRQTQLDELNQHWREALHKKQGKVIFLTGEVGIGKTSLLDQFSRTVLKNYSGVQYAYAQCDQVAGDISPYAPFVQLLNNLTEQAAKKGDNWFVEYMREVGPDVLGMVPVAGSLLAVATKSVDFIWQRRKQSQAAAEDRSRFGQQDLFQQFTDTFRNLALKKNPLLLCIDDWHWADTSSTNLLFHLGHQLNDISLLLLATYRPHDAQRREHPILQVQAELERYDACSVILLEFLSREELVTYLNQRFSQTQFEADFIDWLLKLTGGNALFITEYLNLLNSEKLLTPDGQLVGNLTQLEPPKNVEAVIRTRIGYLDQEARDMLAYASVEGEQFTILTLSHLLDLKPLPVLRQLRTIEEVHQLIADLFQQTIYEQRTTVYRFIHALIHHTLYQMLKEEERQEIHRLLLGLLTEIYEKAELITRSRLLPELINHASEASDYPAVVRYALAAAEEASKSYAHTEVLKQCDRGLEALNKLPLQAAGVEDFRLNLLSRRGSTEYFVGEWSRSAETLQQAEGLARSSLENEPKLTWILNKLGRVYRHLGKYEQARQYYNEAHQLSKQGLDKVELAISYRGLSDIFWRQGNYEQALTMGQKALEIDQTLDNKASLAISYNTIGLIYDRQGKYKQALKVYQQAMRLNRKLGRKMGLAWNYNSWAVTTRNRGNYRRALNLFHRALSLWQELDYKRGEGVTINYIGLTHNDMGVFEMSKRELEGRFQSGKVSLSKTYPGEKACLPTQQRLYKRYGQNLKC